MTVPGNIDALLLGGQGGYQIERSLRFNSADSAYLNRTPASAGNQKTWTWSGWVKKSGIAQAQTLFARYTASNDAGFLGLYFNSTETLNFTGWNTVYRTTSALYRDASAWYHVALSVDTTQATAANRIKLYVNGSEVTAFSTSNNPTQNDDLVINAAAAHEIGRYASSNYLNGYLTEVHFIDGQALDPSSFGETDTITGVWKPKRYAGTYGTNGFYLKFADNSGTTSTTLGKDSSGNSNNWTPNNFSVTAGAGNDSLIDTPTPYADGGNGRGNYPTWNPLDRTAATYSNGNLDVTSTSAASPYNMTSTMRFPATGKWYAEVTLTGLGAGSPSIGIGKNNSDAYAVYRITGAYLTSGMGASTSGTPNTYTTNDVIGIAYDAGAGTLEFYKNGVDQTGNISGITASTEWAIILRADSASGDAATLNAGQRPFAYTPPSGFLALNTQNLPEPSIKKPSSYFNTVLFTGNTSTAGVTQAITGVGFAPDLVWVKTRNQAFGHYLYDAVRGVGASGKLLQSNNTNAESTNAEMDSLDADGFTVKYTGTNVLNWSSSNNVAWCWDESATPGFDIVTYTGTGSATTVAHNLGVAPSMIIAKGRTNVDNWPVGHTSRGWDRHILLNSTAAEAVTNSTWNNTAPTSSVFTVGTDTRINQNGINYVAYLWSEIAGFSKFGSYTGNGSSDGPFVFCGFRPALILIKSSTAAESWEIMDNKRDVYNGNTGELRPNASNAETTTNQIDFLSNGFKIRTTAGQWNTNSQTYIFAAFSESAFKYSLAR